MYKKSLFAMGKRSFAKHSRGSGMHPYPKGDMIISRGCGIASATDNELLSMVKNLSTSAKRVGKKPLKFIR
jgi:hypothetical protein